MPAMRRPFLWPYVAAPAAAAVFASAAAASLRVAAPSRQVPVGLEPVAEVGCTDCTGAPRFGVPTAVAFDGRRLLVADRDPPHLRLFDLGGGTLGVLGPHGDGPGEVRFPMAAALAPDGGLAVLDMQRRRVVVLGPDGGERASAPMGGFPLAAAFVPGAEALLVVTGDFRGAPGVGRWTRSDGEARVVVEALPGLRAGGPGDPLFLSLAAGPNGGWAVGEGRDHYRIGLFAADGSPAGTVTREVDRVRRTGEELAALRDAALRDAARRRPRPQGPPPGTSGIDPLRPHFGLDALRFDDAGRLWVRTERGGEGGTVFDLFGAGGVFLGELRVDARVTAYSVRSGHLVAAVLGDLDVASVRVWRIRG